MCSPELTRGLCQICTGALTPENTQVDRDGNEWDVHKGVCAIHAGCVDAVPYRQRVVYSRYMNRIKQASSREVRRLIIKGFYKWVEQVAEENHYHESDYP